MLFALIGALAFASIELCLLDYCLAAPERPLVFIPGILGSRLTDSNGHVVWGDRNSLLNYTSLEIGPGSTAQLLKPDGLIENINVLGPFWTIHQYDSLLRRLHGLGYIQGENLFIFAYDWRQSNFETARIFASYVNSIPVLRTSKFDLAAHSMGGLIAKVWMLEHGGSNRVRKAIYLGTPFQGSMNSLATVSAGWGAFANYIAGGLAAVRRVSLSFPALFELFPTYSQCCRLGTPTQHTFLDILNSSTWTERDWLPSEYRPGAPRATAFSQGLTQARRMGDLMRHDLSDVQEIKFAGDVIDTKLWLYVPREEQSWKKWTFSISRGDGTVPVWSASNNFSTTAGTNPSFVEHATIFSDEWLGNKLARELVSDAPPPVRAEELGQIATASGMKRLSLASAALNPPVTMPGKEVTLELVLEFDDPVIRGDVTPVALFVMPQSPISLTETTTPNDLDLRRLTYRATLVAPAEEDTYRIDIRIPGQGARATYLTVLAANRRKS